jgi:CheY-like chemotaxis protein
MNKKRILVVDDDVTTLRLLKIGLESTGFYQVREESRGAWAFKAALEFNPDMVVLDVCMGEVDGGDVAAQIRANPLLRDVPIVFLTSMVSEDEASSQPIESGGYKFLAKPVKIRQLCQHIEERIGSAAATTVS